MFHQEIERLGGTAELADVGQQTLPDGEIPLPPVILGQIGTDANKKTVLVYGHLDVQPAQKVQYELWNLLCLFEVFSHLIYVITTWGAYEFSLLVVGCFVSVPMFSLLLFLLIMRCSVLLLCFVFQSDGWHTDPFVLTEKDGKLYGRGATDDKVWSQLTGSNVHICHKAWSW